MTGYGRGYAESPLGAITVDLQSVNRKHLEINAQLDSSLVPFEGDIRRQVAQAVQRGSVTVKVRARFPKMATTKVEVNIPLAVAYSEAWTRLSAALHKPVLFNVQEIVGFEGVLEVEPVPIDEAATQALLFQALEQALEAFQAMRRKEGRFLETDFLARLERMEGAAQQIEAQSQGVTDRYRDKLMERLKSLGLGAPEEDERVLREIALFAEKCDITEELTRLQSHLNQAKSLVQSDAPIGKMFEFLLQEVLRETNTIGSKANDLMVTRAVLEMKTWSEQMREQIQNVE